MRLKANSINTPCLTLAEFTDPALVVPELRERDMAGVIKELTQLLHQHGWIQDSLPFYHAALTREYLASTSTGRGLAFPHARMNTDDHLRFAFGKSPEPFPWGAPRSPRVQYVFVVVAPMTDTSSYLHLLSGLARLGKTEQQLAQLRDARTPDQVMHLLGQVRLPIPAAPAWA